MASPAERTGERTRKVVSQRFGSFEIPEDRVFRFGNGLIGFPKAEHFVLLDHRPGSPFKWMLSLEDPELAFAVANPSDLVSDYSPPLKKAAKQLSANDADVAIFALVTIPSDPTQMTINLMAPVAVDLRSMTAEQLILDRPDLSPAHPVVAKPAEHNPSTEATTETP